jgi:hypothetical protein
MHCTGASFGKRRGAEKPLPIRRVKKEKSVIYINVR